MNRRGFLTLAAGAAAIVVAAAMAAWRFAPRRPDASLRVAAAVSLREAMAALGAAFESATGTVVSFTFGSSGQVAGQVRGGAPIDLFVAASHEPMDALADAGLVDPASRRVIAGNALVLIAPAGADDAPAGFADLAAAGVRRLAMGEPNTVPAGQYASQVLASLKLTDALRGRVVYGMNVRQVLSYVERGEASAGIVYRTDATEAGDRVRVVAAAEAAWHDAIAYPAAIVTNTPRRTAAEAFLNFLATPEARRIIEARGFTTPTGAPTPRPRP